MASLNTIHQALATDIKALNDRILKQLTSSSPLMDTVVNTFLQAKGKQIRPIIVILTAKMLSRAQETAVSERVLEAAASVELLHNASLIHDDVVDCSKLRRGMPTINAIWDNHIAVLVGDFFVSSALQQAIATGDIRIVQTLCQLGSLLSLGELDQIYNARFHSLTEEAYFHIISQKTASLFVACAQMGGFAVKASDEAVEKAADFARLLGLCFQLRDDVLDYFPSPEIGKPSGNDLREGKITLPLLYALNFGPESERGKMKELVSKEVLDEEDITILNAFAIESGGIDYAFQRMKDLRDEAAEILAKNFPQNEAASQLLSILDEIIAKPKK